MRSPGLGSQSRPAQCQCQAQPSEPEPGRSRSQAVAGSRREEWTLDTEQVWGVRPGVTGSVCHSRLLNATAVPVSLSLPSLITLRCTVSVSGGSQNMPGRGILTSRCQVSLSAFLISESDWVIEARWAPVSGAVGSEICYHYALCQTYTRSSQIQIPRYCRYIFPSQRKEGEVNQCMRRRRQINIEISLAPGVCHVRLGFLIVCSGHLHILVPPPSLPDSPDCNNVIFMRSSGPLWAGEGGPGLV